MEIKNRYRHLPLIISLLCESQTYMQAVHLARCFTEIKQKGYPPADEGYPFPFVPAYRLQIMYVFRSSILLSPPALRLFYPDFRSIAGKD